MHDNNIHFDNKTFTVKVDQVKKEVKQKETSIANLISAMKQ